MLHSIVNKAIELGYTVSVDTGGDEPDYVGTDKDRIIETANDVDMAELSFTKPGYRNEWLMYIPGLAWDEQIADYTTGGFIDSLMEG